MIRVALFLAGWLAFESVLCPAQAGQVAETLPNYDRRRAGQPAPARMSDQQAAAVARLGALAPGTQVETDSLLGTPVWIVNWQGPLTGPKGEGKALSRRALGAWPAKDPDRTTKAFVVEHRRLFGHGAEALEGAVKLRDYLDDHNGLRTTVWAQYLDGIPIHEAFFAAHITKAGELAAASSRLVPAPASAADAEHPQRKKLQSRPGIGVGEAVRRAAEALGEHRTESDLSLLANDPESPLKTHEFKVTGLPGSVRASLTWLPMSASRLRLCWAVRACRSYRGESFLVLVDSESGEVMVRRNLTFDSSEATYRVFAGESPAPMSPGWTIPSTNQAPSVSRTLLTLSALDTNASPKGWIDEGINETLGNNVDAHADADGDNRPDLPRPQGSPHHVFDFPLDLQQEPASYRSASVVQLFYWCNWMHDQLYRLGFTEAAGNFQKDNFGRGGLGGDPVLADAADGSGYNNANYTAAPDGESPRIQMFLFNATTPMRDGDLDASVVLHEYTHGLSDRLVGSGVGISEWQTTGLAEGWSDFYALSLLGNPADAPGACYPFSPYISYLWGGLKESYYFGIRRYPYTTDMSKNPLTFKDIDANQASFHLEVPRNPTSTGSATEVHKIGEVWCAALWEVRANLIEKLGPTNGNWTALKLVTDGMRLSPPNPNFVQARNAIILADVFLTGGAHRKELWAGFAKRGLGYNAVCPESSTTVGVRESFDLPDSLVLASTNTFFASLYKGGPFEAPSTNYVLINAGAVAINWTNQSAPFWVTVQPLTGGLAPGASNTVNIAISEVATNLGAGTYSGTVVFANLSSGQALMVPVQLTVTESGGGSSPFVNQVFNGNGDFDLDYRCITFTPDTSGGESGYSVCTTTVTGFPTDPAGGTPLTMVDDCYDLITLGDGKEVSLYGSRTNQVLVGSNGDIVFDVPTSLGYSLDPTRGIYTNFFYSSDSVYFVNGLRVAPLYVDLNPGTGGTVSWRQLPDRLAVTWQNVPEYGISNTNSFQVEWFFDGIVRFTYAGIAPAVGANYTTPKVGLARGDAVQQTTDFSAHTSCLPLASLLMPGSVTEGEGPWEGMILLASPPDRTIEVAFSFSDTNASVDPVAIQIPPGQTSANFFFDIPDDHRLLGTRVVTASISIPGYDRAIKNLQVFDRTSASLTVKVPSAAREGQGHLTGQVSMNAIPEVGIAVQLSSTSPSLVQVPGSVVIPAGTNAASFDLNILEDNVISGPVAVAIVAHVPNWDDDADAIVVADTESTNLVLFLSSQEVSESAGTLAKVGRVSLNGYLPTNLTVSLVSAKTNVVQVPPTVTIEARQLAASFDLVVLDNKQVTGTEVVGIQASAPGFVGASKNVRVLDDESPSYPTNPSPASLASKVSTDVVLNWEVRYTGVSNSLSYDVYFGANPVPSQADLLGTTETNRWLVQNLQLNTTYYWQVTVKAGEVEMPGPIWQFTTVSLDHFVLSPVEPGQVLGVPIPLTITALDQAGETATGFDGSVHLNAARAVNSPSTIVISEVETASSDRIELVNVSSQEVNISGWKIYLYDWQSWPAPQVAFTMPEGTIAPPSVLFQLKRSSTVSLTNYFPYFTFTNTIAWNNNPNQNPVAVLVLDSATNVVDFFCAVDADSSQVTQPVPVPPSQWSGPPVIANTSTKMTYQRLGAADRNDATDWAVVTNTVGKPNPGMTIPFYDLVSVPVEPEELGPFTNGVWSGFIQFRDAATNVLAVATNVFLTVGDEQGHVGTGNVFAVSAPNDLALFMGTSPGRKTVLRQFEYRIAVTNSGPSSATGVVLIDSLPAGADFVSAQSSQGMATRIGASVVCDLGTVAGGGAAVITITVLPRAVTTLTNRAVITRLEQETFTGNNGATNTTTVNYSLLSVADAAVVEGNTNTTNLVFQIRLSEPCQEAVRATYATSDGTAVAGSDYVATSGSLVLAPGETNATVTVPVLGDTLPEANETVVLNLFNATNALIIRGAAVGTITNDDTVPAISIYDTTVTEGDTGTNFAKFTVSLAKPSGVTASISWATTNDTATAYVDFLPSGGSLQFQPYETNKEVSVPILGNTVGQANRAFAVYLYSPKNISYMPRPRAVGTIMDDDAWRLHHFAWSALAPIQYIHEAIPVQITAQNMRNETVTDFQGLVALRAGSAPRAVSIGTGTNAWEIPFGAYYHDSRLQTIYQASELGGAGSLTGLSLDVAGLPGQSLGKWTIRLRHTSKASYYDTAAWETNWTVVYQTNQFLATNGWTTFHFQTPFEYNGTDHLMVDFSFNNASYTSDGFCRATLSSNNAVRSLYFRSDSAFGDPLLWAGTADPAPTLSQLYPNARFTMDTAVKLSPVAAGDFVNGVWMGHVQLDMPASNVVLQALHPGGFFGQSAAFDAMVRDTDGDGMPDEWEIANKLDILDPTDAGIDADGDSMTNLEEYLAGTDPRDPKSFLRIAGIASIGLNRVVVSFASSSNRHYQLVYANSITNQVWTPCSVAVPGTGGLLLITNRLLTNEVSRFFRVSVGP